MTKEEFSKIAAAIRTFYPNQNILPNIESVSLWYIQLCDIDYETMTAAVYEWVATNKWAPTIADLRESSRRITMGDIPDWDEITNALVDDTNDSNRDETEEYQLK